MVSVKQVFIATSLLLSGVAAAPFPTSDLSVTAAEIHAINDYAIESRGLNDNSVVDIEARKSKSNISKTPKPKKPTKPKGPKTPANGAACPINKPKGSRDLERRGAFVRSTDPNNIDENKFILSTGVKSTTVTVTDLSGCTALFFWDKNFKPSVFHIFCGEEKVRVPDAAERVGDIPGGTKNGVTIFAGDKDHYDAAEAAIRLYNAGIDESERFEVNKNKEDKEDQNGRNIYGKDDQTVLKPGALKRFKITARVGDKTKTLKVEAYEGQSKQCQ